jgi:hypothetical protein
MDKKPRILIDEEELAREEQPEEEEEIPITEEMLEAIKAKKEKLREKLREV